MPAIKIAYTSCMDATRVPSQPVWTEIEKQRPDVLLILGDQIYMDWRDLGRSNWLRQIMQAGAERSEVLQDFVSAMHARYAAQWHVREFRDLIRSMPDYGTGRQIYVTWDDHDFAWNNALGAAPTDHKRHVPPEVKAISRALFEQFRNHLRGTATDDYPAAPAAFPSEPGATGIEQLDIRLRGSDGSEVPLAMLDIRWYRTQRPLDKDFPTGTPSILGNGQWSLLQTKLAAGEGLLLVACGSPLMHTYRLGHQSWHAPANEGGSYPEAQQLLQVADRPILLIAGDIHRNAWGGRLPIAGQAQRSRVLQTASSGAAIGQILTKRFAPSYGILEVTGLAGGAGTVKLNWFKQDRNGSWPDGALLECRFSRDDWLDPAEGEAIAALPAFADAVVADAAPLAVCTMRKRDNHQRVPPDQVTFRLDELDRLNDQYEDFDAIGDWPEPMEVEAEGGAEAISLSYRGNRHDFQARNQEVTALMVAAFERALARGGRSVVLYIHGDGKTAVEAIDDGYRLRAAFPECEPIVFSWPSGHGSGFLQTYFGFRNALKMATQNDSQRKGISAAVGQFNLLSTSGRFNGLTKVILARSLGAMALAGASKLEMPGVDRIVLSAATLSAHDFEDGYGFFANPVCPIFVTVNQEDQTLRNARWVMPMGERLGLVDPTTRGGRANATYIDFTAPAIGPLHDYLLPHITDAQREVHTRLLCDKQFNPAVHPDALAPVPGREDVFRVR
jgi:hypothetical protein